MKVCVVVEDKLSPERAALAAYVARTLLVTLGLPHEVVEQPRGDLHNSVVVWHGSAPPDLCAGALVEVPVHRLPDVEGPINWLKRLDDGRRVAFPGEARHVAGRPLYEVEGRGECAIASEGKTVRAGVDILGAAGFWLTCRDEASGPTDEFGRRIGSLTPRAKAGLLTVPVVTDLMNLLWEMIETAAHGAGLQLVRVGAWPPPYRFAVLLSHDVDLWRKRTARQLAKEVARSAARPWRLGKVAKTFLRGPDPWSDLEQIADIEEARGMCSTFFALPGRPDILAGGIRVVNGYDAPPEAVAAKLRRLTERGFEVALHGSFVSFDSPLALTEERQAVAEACGREVSGCRQHFLRLEVPGTWQCQVEAGLHYDATLGYHDCDGYRGGFSFPFKPFAGRELPLLELPLVVMDGVLRERLGLAAEAAWEVVCRYLERAAADGGMLTLLWHNHYFCDLDAPGYRAVYERALDWVRDHGGWGASADRICRWWQARCATTVGATFQAERTGVKLHLPEGLDRLALEVLGAVEFIFEASQGEVVGRCGDWTRCVLRDVVPGGSTLILRRR